MMATAYFFSKGNPRFVFPSLLIMCSVLCANTQCHFQIATRPTQIHHLEFILNPFVGVESFDCWVELLSSIFCLVGLNTS